VFFTQKINAKFSEGLPKMNANVITKETLSDVLNPNQLPDHLQGTLLILSQGMSGQMTQFVSPILLTDHRL